MFYQTSASKKTAKKFRTAARHVLAVRASLWRVMTFKSLLGASRHSLIYITEAVRISNRVYRLIAAKLRPIVTQNL